MKRGADARYCEGPARLALGFTKRPLRSHFDIAVVLLEKGADVEAKGEGGMALLVYTSHKGHFDFAMGLFDKGADVEAKDKCNRTPLVLAPFKGFMDIAMAKRLKYGGGAG